MKVIKEGKLPEQEVLRRTCANCKTVMEFEKGEAKSSPDQREPGLYVDCPRCGRTVWV